MESNVKYTPEQLKDLIYHYGSQRKAAHCLGINESTIRYHLKKGTGRGKESIQKVKSKPAQKDTRPIASGTISNPDDRRKRLNGKRFVFTSAQNNTYVHENFFNSLQTFCKHNKAELFVSQFTYNKSGFQNLTKEGTEVLWYDERLLPYLLNTAVEVSEGLIFCGELDILPTAANPLSGLETYCFGNSGIVPHAKVAEISLPRLKGEDARFLYTTGAVTQRNYIQRKAGQKAEFHHVFGALYVEVDEQGEWFVRQLIADNTGEFYDLTNYYTPDDVEEGCHVMGINWGDVHIEKQDWQVSAASWYNPDSMLNILKPTYQFIHDLTDFTARNHHSLHDPYQNAEKYYRGEDVVVLGLKKSAEFLKDITKNGGFAIVVESNHHEALEKWLREADGHSDPVNAEFWHKANHEIYKSIRTGDTGFNVYEWALNQEDELINVIFLGEDESFVICNNALAEEEGKIIGGIECGIHGHRGVNGSRGSTNSFRTIGRKCNTGHTHSAAIADGVYTAGVSGKLDMDYNRGASSWSHSHIITYANGKRAIVTIKNGKWKA